MKVKDIAEILEEFAPLSWQEEWDNSGLQVGDPQAEVNGILLTLDVTDSSMDAAINSGADMIISHHPLLFSPVKSVTPATAAGDIIIRALKAGISIYSCHTSIDNAPGGVNYRLARKIGLKDICILQPLPEGNAGMGCTGTLPEPMEKEKFLALLKEKFDLKVIRTNNSTAETIRTVAVCGGAGFSLLDKAISRGADTFITGDLKYHNFGEAPRGMLLADIGHFESEVQILKLFYELITEKFPKFAVLTECADSNHVNYYL